MEKSFFLGFEQDFSVDFFPVAAEQFPEGKIMEKPFFLGFEWDFSMFWEEKKHLEKLVLGWPGAGSARVWGGFGNIWNQTQQEHPGLIPNLWNVPELLQSGISPQIPFLGRVFLTPPPGARMGGIFFWGWKSQILGSGAAKSWELIPLIGSL